MTADVLKSQYPFWQLLGALGNYGWEMFAADADGTRLWFKRCRIEE